MKEVRKFNFFAAATLMAAVSLASCNVKDNINESGSQPVRFTADIGQAATPQGTPGGTRASGTEWAASDKIGIFMVDHGTSDVSMSAANRQHNVSNAASGTFAPESGHEIYYPQSGDVDFIAYYPYAAANSTLGNIDVEIGATQTTASQATFDLLWAKADKSGGGYTKGDVVALAFDHKLAKIVMNIVKPSTLSPNNTGLTDADLVGMRVAIKGMNTKNTFDLSTGTLGTADTSAPITPSTIATATGFAASYDAIIMPASATASDGDFYVEFTINPTTDPETFTWQMPAGTIFEGGNEYTYDVTLSRTVVSATGTITPWTSNDRGDVTAE